VRRRGKRSLLSEAMDTDRRLRDSPYDDASDMREKMAALKTRLFVRSLAIAAAAAAILLILWALLSRR
jgi:hypothetical protein